MEELSQGQLNILKKKMADSRIEKNRELAKKALTQFITKHMTTVFIGALAAFEAEFGELWGIQKRGKSDLSEDERVMYEIWEKIRNTILNNGNAQLRAIQNELEHYNVENKTYQLTFIVKE